MWKREIKRLNLVNRQQLPKRWDGKDSRKRKNLIALETRARSIQIKLSFHCALGSFHRVPCSSLFPSFSGLCLCLPCGLSFSTKTNLSWSSFFFFNNLPSTKLVDVLCVLVVFCLSSMLFVWRLRNMKCHVKKYRNERKKRKTQTK